MRLDASKAAIPVIAVLAIGLSGCGNDEDVSTGNSDQSTGAPPAPDVTLDIAVADGEVSPAPQRVDVARGDRVRILITSDQADEVHLHGYDVSAEIGPDHDEVLEFTADEAGLFDVETHDSGLLVTQLAVE